MLCILWVVGSKASVDVETHEILLLSRSGEVYFT